MEGLELPLYSWTRGWTPGVFGLPSFPLPFWCPVKGCAGDVACLSSHHMSDSSPSPSHDGGAHAVLVASGEMLVGDGLGPEYSDNSNKVLDVEGEQFLEVAFRASSSILSRAVV